MTMAADMATAMAVAMVEAGKAALGEGVPEYEVALAILAGGNFLDYSVLGQTPAAGQHLGIILIELGVGMTVASVVILLYYAFTNR